MDEITFPFQNLSSETIEVMEWISNFIPHFTGHVITYPTKLENYPLLVKKSPL